MQRVGHRLAAIGIGAGALAAAGCGGGGGATTAQTATQPATTGQTTGAATPGAPGATAAPVNVDLTEFKVSPANPKVKAGTVAFKVNNRGATVHALEVEGPGGEVETRRLQPGQSQTIRVDLDRPGSYEMYCPVGNHKDQGMEGQVTVQ